MANAATVISIPINFIDCDISALPAACLPCPHRRAERGCPPDHRTFYTTTLGGKNPYPYGCPSRQHLWPSRTGNARSPSPGGRLEQGLAERFGPFFDPRQGHLILLQCRVCVRRLYPCLHNASIPTPDNPRKDTDIFI